MQNLCVEVDGSPRLREMLDTFERQEVHCEVEWCRHGNDLLHTLWVPSIDLEAVNIALDEECDECAGETSADRAADYAIAEMRSA